MCGFDWPCIVTARLEIVTVLELVDRARRLLFVTVLGLESADYFLLVSYRPLARAGLITFLAAVLRRRVRAATVILWCASL